jgi:primosomal protein N'
MDYFYDILVTRNLGGSLLTYSSDCQLKIGNIVRVPLQNKSVFGVVIACLDTGIERELDLNKIKPISEVFPYSLNSSNLQFLSAFSLNTFNSKNLVLDSLLNPLELLIKKDLLMLNDSINKDAPVKHSNQVTSSVIPPKTSIYNESDVLIRIRYIIRSKDNALNKGLFKLFIFPERKLLEKIYNDLKNDSEFCNLQIYKYLADKSKFSKQTIKQICGLEAPTERPKIIFSLRAGIFLPINNLTEINLIDESNSLYIQEQNRVYFDTREASFLLSHAFSADLNFISHLPSGRLFNYSNNKDGLQDYGENKISASKKPLNIQITYRNPKVDQFNLFSDYVEQEISGAESDQTVFETDAA